MAVAAASRADHGLLLENTAYCKRVCVCVCVCVHGTKLPWLMPGNNLRYWGSRTRSYSANSVLPFVLPCVLHTVQLNMCHGIFLPNTDAGALMQEPFMLCSRDAC